MEPRINYQNVNVNILDADTREVIQHDFQVYIYPIDGGHYRTIRGGCDTLSNLPVKETSFVNFGFLPDQVIASGYDPASIQGYLVDVTSFDSGQGTGYLYTMPRVVNITMRKLG